MRASRSGCRALRVWEVRSWRGGDLEVLPLAVVAVVVSAMWDSSSARRVERSVRVETDWRGRCGFVATVRWRWRVRVWIILMRWDRGRTSDARRKMVRL